MSDDDIEIVHEEIIPLKPGVQAFVRQQIHLLRNLKLNYTSWIPTNYTDFLECVKSLKTSYQSNVILATWRLLLDKHLSTMVPEDLKSKTKTISALGQNITEHHKGLKYSTEDLKTLNIVSQNKKCANISRNFPDPSLLQTVLNSRMLNSVEKSSTQFKNPVDTEKYLHKKPEKEFELADENSDKSKLKDLNRPSKNVQNTSVSNIRTSSPKQNHSATKGIKPNINETFYNRETLDNSTKSRKRKAVSDHTLVDDKGCLKKQKENSKILKKIPATSNMVGDSDNLNHNSLSKYKSRRQTREVEKETTCEKNIFPSKTHYHILDDKKGGLKNKKNNSKILKTPATLNMDGDSELLNHYSLSKNINRSKHKKVEEREMSCENNILPSKIHKKYNRKSSESDFIKNSHSWSEIVSDGENEVNQLSVSCPEITSNEYEVNNSPTLSFKSRGKHKKSNLKLKKKKSPENANLEDLCTSVLGYPYKNRKSKSKFKNIDKSVFDSGINKSDLIQFLKKQNEEKLKEEKKLEKQMLEAFHERLVDVIIPKYYSLNK